MVYAVLNATGILRVYLQEHLLLAFRGIDRSRKQGGEGARHHLLPMGQPHSHRTKPNCLEHKLTL